jgi:decaprenylphospho-beta-D-erythro-pentofuranosid-2-ulose 2-reductase
MLANRMLVPLGIIRR